MRLYVVRHAEAVDAPAGTPDANRWLTPRGRLSFRRTADIVRGAGARPEAIFTSPLARAVQTAEILAERTGFEGAVAVAEILAPGGDHEAVAGLLAGCAGSREVALVGHEPDMSRLVQRLLSLPGPIPLKKGAVMALELDLPPGTSPGSFLWMTAGEGMITEFGGAKD